METRLFSKATWRWQTQSASEHGDDSRPTIQGRMGKGSVGAGWSATTIGPKPQHGGAISNKCVEPLRRSTSCKRSHETRMIRCQIDGLRCSQRKGLSILTRSERDMAQWYNREKWIYQSKQHRRCKSPGESGPSLGSTKLTLLTNLEASRWAMKRSAPSRRHGQRELVMKRWEGFKRMK